MRSAADASEAWTQPRPAPSRRGLFTLGLCVLAAAWTVAYAGFNLSEGMLAWDVRFAYLPAADSVLDGESPYPSLDDPILEEQKGYVYPPQLVVALLPLAPLPVDVAAVLATLLMLGLLVATLRILGVRDLRCYAALLLWMPTMSGVLLANVSIPLAFALALAWRYRAEIRVPAIALGIAVSAKLLLWPMLVWTVAMQRVRVALWAVAVGGAVTLAAWAALGFAGLAGYPDLLRRLSEIQSTNSYSLVGIASTLGLGEPVGQAITLLVGGALLVWCVVFARRDEELQSFTCAIAATLALSPIVWLHYVVVLVVPLAIARPRFTVLWLLPIVLVASPRPGYAEGFQTFLPAAVVLVMVATLLARPAATRPALAESAA